MGRLVGRLVGRQFSGAGRVRRQLNMESVQCEFTKARVFSAFAGNIRDRCFSPLAFVDLLFIYSFIYSFIYLFMDELLMTHSLLTSACLIPWPNVRSVD